ncbi:VOC family protein, partial [Rhizobium ruizarguesonis]
MARRKEIVIDGDIPSRVARVWAEALDGDDGMPYDDEEL